MIFYLLFAPLNVCSDLTVLLPQVPHAVLVTTDHGLALAYPGARSAGALEVVLLGGVLHRDLGGEGPEVGPGLTGGLQRGRELRSPLGKVRVDIEFLQDRHSVLQAVIVGLLHVIHRKGILEFVHFESEYKFVQN